MPGTKTKPVLVGTLFLAAATGLFAQNPSDQTTTDFTHLPAIQQPLISPLKTKATQTDPNNKDWKWVHIGAAANLAGYTLDLATSLHQPEGNNLLAGSNGRFDGKALEIKTALQVGETVIGYVIARKFPTLRKSIGVLLAATGAVTIVQGVRNLKLNPALH